jgi:hypothetical protein
MSVYLLVSKWVALKPEELLGRKISDSGLENRE